MESVEEMTMESTSTHGSADQEMVGENLTGEMEKVGATESASTHDPTGVEMVGEMVKESTSTDEPTGPENQMYASQIPAREMPVPPINVVTVLEPDFIERREENNHVLQDVNSVQPLCDISQKSKVIIKDGLQQAKEQKKRVKRETEPPERFPWRSEAIEGSHPALRLADIGSLAIVPAVPFEATCPGPPQTWGNSNQSMTKPYKILHQTPF